ncbi:DUF6882 domain-containing protein [Streptomyces sp. G-G2]|uniref:DUF6882 domain-containing protein n=1 Tax=Streptomyces sp. G-G2 TaxID=3046201 RepID=UPI0024BB4605|nr:DUF6882 domain-containing protein [Streptomyces sp. G-G2]MDJ0382022.1 hypothetical protein [Streptomyces sp. G-G2]
MVSQFSDAFLFEAERHAAWGAAQLEALTAFLPDGGQPWTADLPSCVYEQGGLRLRIGVLGTYDTDERSWMWGWANPGLRGTEVVALSGAVARYGRIHGIAELSEEVVDLSGFADPHRAAETLAFAGMGVAEAPGYLGLPAGPGTRVYFLPDDPRVPGAAFDPIALPRTLVTGASLIGRSGRRVVTGFLDHHGMSWRESGDRITADLPSGRAAEIDLDRADRIAAVRLTVGS